MTLTASAVSAVEDAFIAALVADAGIIALELERDPHLAEPQDAPRTDVWIGEVVESEQEGELSVDDEEREETFDLFVWCLAAGDGDDFVGVRDRCAEIADAVVTVVVANQDLGIPNCDIRVGGVRRESGVSTGNDRIILNVVTVRCQVTVT